MGLVKMAEEVTKEWEDINGTYPFVTATLYVYCDQCGSFNIRPQLGPTKALLISASSLFLAAMTISVFHLNEDIYLLLFLIFPTVCILGVKHIYGHTNLVCAKCGSEPMLERNTLGYPSDPDILDVPEAWTQKLYVEYFPDTTDWINALESLRGNGLIASISHDIKEIADFLWLVVAIPLFLLFPVVYIILLVFYLLRAGISYGMKKL